MSRFSSRNGKSWEFAVADGLARRRWDCGMPAVLMHSHAFEAARGSCFRLPPAMQEACWHAANASAAWMFQAHPLFSTPETLCIGIAPDSAGVGAGGFVGDVLVWDGASFTQDRPLCISCKHNHEALKHPRLLPGMNFWDWLGIKAAPSFGFQRDMAEIRRRIAMLQGRTWISLGWTQRKDFLGWIMECCARELLGICMARPDAARRLFRYFAGGDHYKLIMKDFDRTVTVEGFNVDGTLPSYVGRTGYPERLEAAWPLDGAPETAVLRFDRGWSISMRLHSRDKLIGPASLGWDVQLFEEPAGRFRQTLRW